MEAALHTLLCGDAGVAALAGDRISPIERYQSDGQPALTYMTISSQPDYAHSGPTGLAQSRVQLDAYAPLYADAKALIDAAKALLSGYSGTVGSVKFDGIFVEDERDFRADGAGGVERPRRIQLDVMIWHKEA